MKKGRGSVEGTIEMYGLPSVIKVSSVMTEIIKIEVNRGRESGEVNIPKATIHRD